jgi:hypothetical protein
MRDAPLFVTCDERIHLLRLTYVSIGRIDLQLSSITTLNFPHSTSYWQRRPGGLDVLEETENENFENSDEDNVDV